MIADRTFPSSEMSTFLFEVSSSFEVSLQEQARGQNLTLDEYAHKLATKGTVSFCRSENGEIMGMIIGYMHNTPDNGSYITQVAVKENFRKGGVFRRMYSEYEEYAKEIGLDYIWLTTGKHNTAARRAYEAVGFSLDESFDSTSGNVKYKKMISK